MSLFFFVIIFLGWFAGLVWGMFRSEKKGERSCAA
jgi:cbb3-type cytochrome oxidase subunit 3